MAAVAKSLKASMDASTGMLNACITKIAGEDIPSAVTPVYLHTDDKVYRASGAAANAAAVLFGWTTRACKAGQPVTVYQGTGTRAKYSDALLTPGQKLFLSATTGALDTAATTGDAVGIAQACGTSDIRFTRLV